jgi:hypothetical protein
MGIAQNAATAGGNSLRNPSGAASHAKSVPRRLPLGMNYILDGVAVRVRNGAGIVDLTIALRRRRIPVRQGSGSDRT